MDFQQYGGGDSEFVGGGDDGLGRDGDDYGDAKHWDVGRQSVGKYRDYCDGGGVAVDWGDSRIAEYCSGPDTAVDCGRVLFKRIELRPDKGGDMDFRVSGCCDSRLVEAGSGDRCLGGYGIHYSDVEREVGEHDAYGDGG